MKLSMLKAPALATAIAALSATSIFSNVATANQAAFANPLRDKDDLVRFEMLPSPAAGCPDSVTPFNGELNAGIQVPNTGTFPDDQGPLRDLEP